MRILVLVGSGEFTSSMMEVDRYLISLLPKSQDQKLPNVAILPTAAGLEEDPEKWITNGSSHFKRLRAKPFGLRVLDRKDAHKSNFIKTIKLVSLIYFSGGEPSYLNRVLTRTPLWKNIYSHYKNGVILTGSSAGAFVMGNFVLEDAQDVFMHDKKELVWKKGLSLINYLVMPHYDWAMREAPQILKRVIHYSPSQVIKRRMGIDEDTALIIFNEKEAQVMGKGKVRLFLDKKEKKFEPGEKFILP